MQLTAALTRPAAGSNWHGSCSTPPDICRRRCGRSGMGCGHRGHHRELIAALRRRDAAAAIDHTVWQFTDAANRLTEMGGRSDPVNPPPRERWSGAIGPPPGDDTAKPVTVSATLGDSPDESSSTDIDTMGLLVSPARIHPTTRAPATGEYAGIEYAALPVMSVAPVRL
jgi:hypothetical protein